MPDWIFWLIMAGVNTLFLIGLVFAIIKLKENYR